MVQGEKFKVQKAQAP